MNSSNEEVSELDLAITQIDFEGMFLKAFDDTIPRKYKNNFQLWTSVRDTYISQTQINKENYLNLVKEYTNLINFKKEGITIMTEGDLFGDRITKMATIICEQKQLYSNFLQYLSHLLEDSFDTKSIVSTRTSRSRRIRKPKE